MKTYLYRTSNLKSTINFLPLFHSGRHFWRPPKTVDSCDLFIININFFRRVFSEYTEAVTTSLIDTILPEICTFFFGFSCTVCTKMRFLRAH